jgi:hypothetical protein
MLNELNFQRKKGYSLSSSSPSPSQIQPEQQKNIYDFILKQDTRVGNLEKELSLLKSEISFISAKFPLIEKRSDEKVAKTELDNLITTFPSKEEIQTMLKNELDKNEMFNSFKQEINVLKEDNISKNKQISQLLNEVKELTKLNQQEVKNQNDNKVNDIHSNKKLCEIQDKTNETILGIKSQTDNYLMQVNKKINDLDNDFNRLIESLKNQFQSVNDLINQVDESKVNISDIKQIVLECLNNNNQEIGMFPKTARTPNVKLSSPWDNNNLLEGYKLKSINDGGQIITQHISAMPSLIPDGMNNNFNQNNFQTKSMKQELIILKNEINSDFERINTKILNELQNQANDIKQLYQEIHTMTLTNKAPNNNPILPMTSSYESNLNSNSFLNSNIIEINNELAKHTSFIMQLDQELTKKANIDQLNYALEAQAKINDALCNANKIARWSWSDDSSVNENGFIIWSIQNINTALDVFSWETNNENIFVNLKGIYKISAGVILTYMKNYNKDIEEDVFYIIVNGENVMSGKRIDEGIVFVEGYIPLPDEAKIQIKMNINRNGRNELDGEVYNTEAFLEIKKLI